MQPVLNLIHLYPGVLNLYGDRGNVITLVRRAGWRSVRVQVHEVGLGERVPDVPIDMLFMGGDQDREQEVVVDDLRSRHAGLLRDIVNNNVPFLAVCGSFQLLQRYYRPATGNDLVGLGIFDAHTIHPGPEVPRCIGNIVATWEHGVIVGFENHGGRTYLEGDTKPLATVVSGFGNNGEDGTEGARVNNTFGTYVHGSLLPKNPAFADLLLRLALDRRYPDFDLAPLDDGIEESARAVAMSLAPRRR